MVFLCLSESLDMQTIFAMRKLRDKKIKYWTEHLLSLSIFIRNINYLRLNITKQWKHIITHKNIKHGLLPREEVSSMFKVIPQKWKFTQSFRPLRLSWMYRSYILIIMRFFSLGVLFDGRDNVWLWTLELTLLSGSWEKRLETKR